MAREKKTDAEAQAAGEAQVPAETGISLPAYYEYEGKTAGSVFGQDHEPVGRFEPGEIIKAESEEAAARIEELHVFRRTTAARYNAQQIERGQIVTDFVDSSTDSAGTSPERTEQDVSA